MSHYYYHGYLFASSSWQMMVSIVTTLSALDTCITILLVMNFIHLQTIAYCQSVSHIIWIGNAWYAISFAMICTYKS